MSPRLTSAGSHPQKHVEADTSVVDVLPRLLDTADRRLGVTSNKEMIGIIDEASLLEGLGRMISARDDSSIVIIETTPAAYSASQIAHAVEDVDVHLVDLWTTPGEGDTLKVTIRVRTHDPSGVVTSLERYGFDVTETIGEENRNVATAMERLLSLNTILNV